MFLVTNKQPWLRAVAHTIASGSRIRNSFQILTASHATSIDRGWMVKLFKKPWQAFSYSGESAPAIISIHETILISRFGYRSNSDFALLSPWR